MGIAEYKQPENILSSSDSELNALFMAIADIIFVVDDRGRYLKITPTNSKLVSHYPKSWLHQTLYDVLPRSQADVFLGYIQQALQVQTTIDFEYKLGVAHQEIWLEASISPINQDLNNTVIWIAKDITQRKQAEQKLREKERLLQLILDNIPQQIFWKNTDSVFLGCNKNWARAAQISSPEDVVGKTDYDLLPSREMAERFRAKDRRIMEADTPELHLIEEKQKNSPDGKKKWLDFNKLPIHNSEGEVVGILCTIEDITDRMESEEALKQAEAKYRNIFENAVEGIFQSTSQGKYLSANPALARILGYSSAQELIATMLHISHIYVEPNRYYELLDKLNNSNTEIEFESQVYRKNGSIIWISENSRAVFDSQGKIAYYEGIVEDITDRKRAEATIRYQAFHDLLTDLPNRNLFNKRLNESLSEAKQDQTTLAVMFLDLDRFKTINDSLGHEIGDRLLQMVVKRLTQSLGEEDTVARWGGDEFTLLLPKISSQDDALEVAQKILDSLKPAFRIDGNTLHTSCSIGIALYPKDGEDGATLIKNADSALYRAKQQGRNNCQLYIKAMNAQAQNLLALEAGLHQALEGGELVVHYQPKLNINTWSIAGMEALVRWQHPEQGLISPSTFIPLAEESGLIIPLAEWVLRSACVQNKAWYDLGLPPIRMAVNISARQFLQANLVSLVTQVLSDTGLEPCLLELEITESVAMQDVDFTKAILKNLYDMGVHISIDDFGTGYCSLSYLKNFPVHTLKVDQSFVKNLNQDPHDKAIVAAVVTLAHGLNLSVVVEGVRDDEQLDYLRSIHCEEIQSNSFSPALDVDAASKLLQRSQLNQLATSLKLR